MMLSILSKFIISAIFFLALFLIKTDSVWAISSTISPDRVDENTPTATVTYSGLKSNHEYFIRDSHSTKRFKSDSSGNLSITFCGDGSLLFIKYECGLNDYFHADTYTIRLACNGCGTVATTKMPVAHYIPNASIAPVKPTPNDSFTIAVCGKRSPENYSADRNTIDFDLTGFAQVPPDPDNVVIPLGGCGYRTFGPLASGDYKLNVRYQGDSYVLWQFLITVDEKGGSVQAFRDPGKTSGAPGKNPCTVGIGGECSTAIGNIPTNPLKFGERILRIGTGLGGGLALILMVIGSIRVLMSSGDQQKLSAGRDMIVAAVAGLLFLIFSVLILQFIGIQILNIPFT